MHEPIRESGKIIINYNKIHTVAEEKMRPKLSQTDSIIINTQKTQKS